MSVSGKKNEMEWLNVSHDGIDASFLNTGESGRIWLRLEGIILHVACCDLATANELLEKLRLVYKKSCILSASNKIIVEVRGSECLEMPLFQDQVFLFSGDRQWLIDFINQKFKRMWLGIERIREIITKDK